MNERVAIVGLGWAGFRPVTPDQSHKELMIYRAAWLKEQRGEFTKEASMAKLFATDMSERVCRKAIQIHGGYGYMREYEVERMYRDQQLCSINEIQRLVIAQRVLES